MKEYQSLAHTRWDCKYHVVFIPKKRKKTIFGAVRKHLGDDVARPGAAKGMQDRGRALDARPPPCVRIVVASIDQPRGRR